MMKDKRSAPLPVDNNTISLPVILYGSKLLSVSFSYSTVDQSKNYFLSLLYTFSFLFLYAKADEEYIPFRLPRYVLFHPLSLMPFVKSATFSLFTHLDKCLNDNFFDISYKGYLIYILQIIMKKFPPM